MDGFFGQILQKTHRFLLSNMWVSCNFSHQFWQVNIHKAGEVHLAGRKWEAAGVVPKVMLPACWAPNQALCHLRHTKHKACTCGIVPAWNSNDFRSDELVKKGPPGKCCLEGLFLPKYSFWLINYPICWRLSRSMMGIVTNQDWMEWRCGFGTLLMCFCRSRWSGSNSHRCCDMRRTCSFSWTLSICM